LGLTEKTQNELNDGFGPQSGVEHGVINRPVGPIGVKVFFNEIGAFIVNPIHQLFSIRLRSTLRSQPPHFIYCGGVQKEPQRVRTVPEEVLRSSANDYAIAGGGGLKNNTFGDSDNAVGVEAEYRRDVTSFIASGSERPNEPVIEWICALFALFHNGTLAVCQAGDFFGEQLVPQLPTQADRDFSRDYRCAAAVFPFNDDDSYHGPPHNWMS
jgi:hypothetical protein